MLRLFAHHDAVCLQRLSFRAVTAGRYRVKPVIPAALLPGKTRRTSGEDRPEPARVELARQSTAPEPVDVLAGYATLTSISLSYGRCAKTRDRWTLNGWSYLP